jgi:hypothetical protein
MALPCLSVTTQYPGVVHETAVNAWPGATRTACDQDRPDQVNALPAPSTAMQKVALVHETPVREAAPKADDPLSRRSGADQLLPFHAIASPVESTATQNEATGQDTSVSVDVVPKTWGWVQEDPFQTDTPPLTDTQKVAVGHEMETTLPQSLGSGDQLEPLK